MHQRHFFVVTVLAAFGTWALGASADGIKEQVAKFSAACPSNLAQLPGYRDLSAQDRGQVCSCVDREVDALFQREPNIDAKSFNPRYRATISMCSREPFVRKFNDACTSNNAEVRALIKKETLTGAKRDKFCACLSSEFWEWQKTYGKPPSASIFGEGAADAARKCDDGQ